MFHKLKLEEREVSKMADHFITKLEIQQVRHLENLEIPLFKDKRFHLILTGRNGAGKTSVLEELRSYFRLIDGENFYFSEEGWRAQVDSFQNNHSNFQNTRNGKKINSLKDWAQRKGIGITLEINNEDEFLNLYKSGEFIVAYYPANRSMRLEIPTGPERLQMEKSYDLEEGPGNLFLKYLIDLKTQQSFARNEGDNDVVENIEAWFNRLKKAFQDILEDPDADLIFDYRNYSMKIKQKDREYALNELSDGYSSVLNIVADLILRMDRKRALHERKYAFDIEGIVMIDELETHLHVELQKIIFPFLVKFFPKIQFIVTTHSPFILTSIEDSIVYDLETNCKIENMSEYSYEGVIEGYFEVDQYSEAIKKKLEEYKELIHKENCSDEECIRRSELRAELSEISGDIADKVKAEFMEIEKQRKQKYDQNR